MLGSRIVGPARLLSIHRRVTRRRRGISIVGAASGANPSRPAAISLPSEAGPRPLRPLRIRNVPVQREAVGVCLLTVLLYVTGFAGCRPQKSPVASPSVCIALRKHRRKAKVAQRPHTTASARTTAAPRRLARESDLHSPTPSSRGDGFTAAAASKNSHGLTDRRPRRQDR